MSCAYQYYLLDSLKLWLSQDLVKVLLTALLIIPRVPTVTGTVVAFKFHILPISTSRSLYLLSLSNSLPAIFWSVWVLISIKRQVCSLKSFIMISGLFT